MVGIETGIELFEDIFFNTQFVGQVWLMYLIIIFATMLLITRVWKDWGVIALPIMIGWREFGMPIPLVFFMIGVIIFVVNVLSIEVVSGAFTGIGQYVGERIPKSGRIKAEHKRMDIKKREKEMQKELNLARYPSLMKAHEEQKLRKKAIEMAKIKKISEIESFGIAKEYLEKKKKKHTKSKGIE